MSKLEQLRRKHYIKVIEEDIRLFCEADKEISDQLSYKIFSRQRSTTNAIKIGAEEACEQIIRHIVKCILMPSEKMTVNHWVNEIAERWIVALTIVASKNNINKFSYCWFFEPYRKPNSRYEISDINEFIRKIKREKYQGELKYKEIAGKSFGWETIHKINYALLNIESDLEFTYRKDKKFLDYDKVKKIINRYIK
jgi:hypothetical protein